MNEIHHIRSIGGAHRFLGLPKPKHPLVSVIDIEDQITQFDYGNVRYVMDFYQVNLKQGISGTLRYGRNHYDFEEGTLVFIKPGQVIQVESQSDMAGASGWTLLFHPDFLLKSSLAQRIDDYSFFDYDIHEALHLSDEEQTALTVIAHKIREEYSQNLDQHSQDLMVANIELLLRYSQRFYGRQFYTRTNMQQDVLAGFHRVVKEYYSGGDAAKHGVLSVKHCAEALNMSPNYLSDLVKSETGRSAKDHIHQRVIAIAKRELLGTNLTVGEIAYGLGFEYPQGLNKLFKSKTGFSPSAFRSSSN